MVSIEEYYESYWDDPQGYYDPTSPMRMALLRRHLTHLPNGASILDAGCGRGEFCQFFQKELGLHSEGIDISQTAIQYAKQQHLDATFHCGPVEVLLAERRGTYDAVFSSEVIEHLFDVPGYLQSLNHLLKPGGTLVVTTPYHGWLKNVVLDTLNYAKHYDPAGQHIRFFNRASLRKCLQDAGFTPSVWTGYGRPWPFWKSFFVLSRKTSEAVERKLRA